MKQNRDEELYPELELPEEEEQEKKPEFELTKQERRWAALGAMKAAFLIGMLYVLGGALLIWLMLTLWD